MAIIDSEKYAKFDALIRAKKQKINFRVTIQWVMKWEYGKMQIWIYVI